MSFQIALSGLSASQTSLEVTSNNIANSRTNGFKESRAEFGDVFSSSISDSSSTSAGKGVRVNKIAQQFSQGTVDFTSRNLDLAINGDGFFVLKAGDGSTEYTRAGAYSADRDGFVVNHSGQKLQVYPPVTDASGEVTFDPGVTTTDLSLPLANSAPKGTEKVTTAINLDAASVPPSTTFSTSNPTSYSYSTSTTIFDSLGASHIATFYYDKLEDVKVTGGLEDGGAPRVINISLVDEDGITVPPVAPAVAHTLTFSDGAGVGEWTVTPAGGGLTGGAQTITFGNSDNSQTVTPSILSFGNYTIDLSGLQQTDFGGGGSDAIFANADPAGPNNTWDIHTFIDGLDQTTGAQGVAGHTVSFTNGGALNSPSSGSVIATSFTPPGAATIDLDINISDMTQFGGEFAVSNLTQNGYATGRLSGLDIDQTGIAFARYTNGQATAIGQLALAKFNSNQNLGKLGDTNFGETFGSGIVQLGTAGTSNFGTVQSGALEASNVDLAEQLVNLIVSQRSFQANSKVITSVDQILQTIINI